MGRADRIRTTTLRVIGMSADERHRARLEAERTERRYDRVRAEAMIQRGWI